jgi:Cysteine-rich secretory protein family
MAPRVLRALALAAAVASSADAATPDFARAVLDGHNAERRAVGVPPLAWSDRLATGAGAWAAHLAALGHLEHSPPTERPGEGENLWMGTAGRFTPSQMVAAWASEKSDFRPGTFPDVAMHGDWTKVGHYTQMIWRRTAEIGCALATAKGWDVLVCRYAPAGNVVGEKVP